MHAGPPAEPAEIDGERLGLLIALAGLSSRAPRDRWVLAQQVRYRVEGAQVAMLAARRARGGSPADPAAAHAADSVAAEHLEAALRLGRGCPAQPEPDGWCDALLGLALHAAGRFVEAEDAFSSAVARARWLHDGGRELRYLLDADARGLLGDGPGDAGVRERLWRLADPFWAVPGNDRRSEHLARQVMARILSDSRNAFGIPWGGDLRELHLRFGWEVAWERTTRTGAPGGGQTIVGHQQDDGFAFVPRGSVLGDAAAIEAPALAPDPRPRREGYAPPYLDSLAPATHQLAVFREGDGLVVYAAIAAPPPAAVEGESTRAAMEPAHASGVPTRSVGSAAGAAPWAAVAFLPWPNGEQDAPGREAVPRVFRAAPGDRAPAGDRLGATNVSGPEAAVWRARADLPAGEYVVSVEALGPDGVGTRARYGLRRSRPVEGVFDLSDLLLFAPQPGEAPPSGGVGADGPPGGQHADRDDGGRGRAGGDPTATESRGEGQEAWRDGVARRMLAATAVAAGGWVGVAWEAYGLRPAGEEVSFDVSLRRRGGSLLRRAGRWLGLLGPDEPVRVRWSDAALPADGAFWRRIVLAVPADAAPGEYVLRVVARAPGRGDVVRERWLTVREADD